MKKNGEVVLVVDDIPGNIEIIAEILQPMYEIKVALNGKKALKIAASKTPPDLILLDIMMPGIDGFEVCKRLKSDQNTKNIPIIFITAKNEFIDEEKGLAIGAVDFLSKPVNPSIVKARVENHLNLSRATKMLEKQNEILLENLALKEEAERRNKHDLTTAGEIQHTLLLESVPKDLGFIDVAAVTVPSRDVDGDFIDFFQFSKNRLDLVVADVMGKGLHAAMVSAGAKNELMRVLWKLSLQHDVDSTQPFNIIEKFRTDLTPGLEQIQKFITMVYAKFEQNNQTMTFVDAGHTPILWYSTKENKWHQLKGANVPVGFPTIRKCEQTSINYNPGDHFIFYSDGLMEGRNSLKEQYGDKALMKYIKASVNKSPSDLIKGLVDDYNMFSQSEELFDDLTIVAVKIRNINTQVD